MMSAQDILKAALAEPSLAAFDDAAASGVLNKTRFVVRRPVRASAVTKLWMQRMILARCWVIATDPAMPFEARVFCRATYDALTMGTFADFDPDDPEQKAKMDAYFGALIAAKAMTEQDRDDTLALGDVEMTGAELFGRPLDESDVLAMRVK